MSWLEAQKHNPANVDICVLPDCDCSKRALKLFDNFQIKHNSFVIKYDDEFKKKINNKTSISTFRKILINNQVIGGYSDLINLSFKDNFSKLVH